MKHITILLLFVTFFIKNLYSTPLEIDVTKGIIEPLPIAITLFNYKSSKEKILSKNIYEVISNNLKNSGLFREISRKAFLQSEEEVYFQPMFRDWSLIDANLIMSQTNAEINFTSGNGVIQTTTGSTSLTFGVNGSEKMRIHSTGDVLIGATNPTSYNSNADDLIITKPMIFRE